MTTNNLQQTTNYYPGSFCLIRKNKFQVEFKNITGKNIKVAVIDSGWDYSLLNDTRIAKGISFIDDTDGFKYSEGEDYSDRLSHGTTCTDIILQIAPDVTIYPIKVFNSKLETNIEVLVKSIKYAIELDVDIINLSLGTKLQEALHPLYYICEKAKQKGIIIVSANANLDVNSYPANFENVISVRTGNLPNKFHYEYYEGEICECIAHGFPDDALLVGGKRIRSGGNSFAAPVISALISLLLQKYGHTNLNDIRILLKKYSVNNQFEI